MSDHPPQLGAGGGREVERLIYFSDAVMAIAMTLLVVDLRLPDALPATASDADLRAALADIGWRFLGFGLSFGVVAIWWNGHNRLFRTLERSDGRLVLANFVFLGAIAFLPFPTAVIGRWGVSLTTPVALYSATNLVAGGALLGMRWHAERAGLIAAEPPLERRRRMAMAALAPIGFALAIPIAYVDATAGALAWMLLVPAIVALRVWFSRQARRVVAAAPDEPGRPPVP